MVTQSERWPGPRVRDAKPFADWAAVAVGGDHVFRADGVGLAGVDVADVAGDAVGVLFERYHLGGVAERRAQFFGAGANQRLEHFAAS